MLVVTRKTDESIIIAENIEVTVLEITRDRVKIGISAPKDVKIIRNELINAQKLNEEASMVPSANAISKLLNKTDDR
ncbi:MAG TPA: carbon storage regulator [Oscillospiraceae bacterium]|nr:carbon storage regulator [Oscillospiraceae bacterium]